MAREVAVDRYRWAERNDGLLTPEVLRADGRSDRAQQLDRRSGRLRSVRRGVVAVNGTPPSWRQPVRAAVLAGGPEVAAARETALRLLTGRRNDADRITLIAPSTRHVRLDGVVAIRCGTIEPGDVTAVDGVRCTSALRTVIDLSSSMSDEALGAVVDDFLRRRMIDLESLRSRVNRLRPAPGRSPARLRRILSARIPGYDPGESQLEARIMLILVASEFPMPTQQHRVHLPGGRYRLDFAWPDRGLYLEGNGFGWHSLSTELDRDARRQNELVLHGWCPIEVTWRMSDDEIRRCLVRFFSLCPPR